MKGNILMDRKKVSISSERQITIPQKFFSLLGFDAEAECSVRDGELIIRPIKPASSGEFDEYILADLISQGLSGNDLLEAFKSERRKIRPAIKKMLDEAEKVAHGEGEYYSYDDVFSAEDEK